MHGLKGANQKSDVLLDTLLSHFASSSFATSRPTSPPFARRLKSIEMQVPQGKGLRSTLKDVGKGGRRGKGVGRGMDVVAPEKMLMGTMMEEVRPAFNVQDIVTGEALVLWMRA